jgi:hypothetical protein
MPKVKVNLGPLDVVTLSDEVRAYMAVLGRRGSKGKGFAGMDPDRAREIQAAGVAARQARAFGPHVHRADPNRTNVIFADYANRIIHTCRCGATRETVVVKGVLTRGKWLKGKEIL